MRAAFAVMILLSSSWIVHSRFNQKSPAQENEQRELAAQRTEVDALPNRRHPAVESLVSQSDTLAAQGALREAIATIKQAAPLNRRIDHTRSLLTNSGKTLLDTPWVDSRHVQEEVLDLCQDQHDLTDRLEGEDIRDAEVGAMTLTAAISGLLQEDSEAHRYVESRNRWQRFDSRLPHRVRSDAGWQAIESRGREGETAWQHGQWAIAAELFRIAMDRAEQWCEGALTPEEKSIVLETNPETLRRLENEKTTLTQQIRDLGDRTASLAEGIAHLTADQVKRDTEAREQISSLQTQLVEKEAALRRAELQQATSATTTPVSGSEPQDVTSLIEAALGYQRDQRWAEAVRAYRQTLHNDPNNIDALNNLAWVLATCPVAEYRDGNQAYALATQALTQARASGQLSFVFFDTLAAAYAECRDFDRAVEYQRKARLFCHEMYALSAADRDGVELRLEIYRSGSPYREGSTAQQQLTRQLDVVDWPW